MTMISRTVEDLCMKTDRNTQTYGMKRKESTKITRTSFNIELF